MEKIVAAGSGRMGCSMAVAFAYAGHAIALLDLKQRSDEELAGHREAVFRELNAHLETLRRTGLIGASDLEHMLNRISFYGRSDAAGVLADADLVLEGVPERLDDKRAAFGFLEQHCPVDCVLASTTSSFLSTTLAESLAEPARFLNAHWLNPAYVIPLVEVSPHAGTHETVTRALCRLLEAIGKVPVVCQPSPGYIVPRLQSLVMNEAARLVQEGVASAEDVDKAVRLGFGMRYASMGVLEFVDFGGMDILHYAAKYMADTVDSTRYASPDIVQEKMARGDVGVRSGQGFYDWSTIDVATYRDDVVRRLAELLKREGLLRPPAAN